MLTALSLSTLAGACTGLGGLLAVSSADADRGTTVVRLAKWEAATAGAMLALSLVELLPEALSTGVSSASACVFFLIGAVLFALLKRFIPDVGQDMLLPVDAEKGRHPALDADAARALAKGLITSAAIFLHNLPEGVAVYAASMKGLQLGVPLAVSIGIHNIPEGLAVGLHVYFATKSRWRAVLLSLLSGAAEPLAVVVAAITMGSAPSGAALGAMLAAVAGVMSTLSLFELVPSARQHLSRGGAATAVAAGAVVMWMGLVVSDWLQSGSAEPSL